jgi:DNA-directed RNA polymerase specialized sigma24 family protein
LGIYLAAGGRRVAANPLAETTHRLLAPHGVLEEGVIPILNKALASIHRGPYNGGCFPAVQGSAGGALPMSSQGSVSRWLGLLQAGDPAAARQLWERYFCRLVGLARTKLHGLARPAADEEDVALSAFDSFCRNAGQGRFPQLHDRDNLWRLLVVITARKAAHLFRDEVRRKRGRGGAPVRGPAAEVGPEQALSREPSPEFAAQVAEECRRLLRLLGDEELESVALLRMEGYTVEEVAEKRGCAPRSVKRKLQLIRTIWEKGAAP